MWGTVTIGGVALREETEADQDGQIVTLAGQESYPPQSRASVQAAHENLTAMGGLVLPVVFGDKEELSGFYRIASARSRLLNHANGAALAATWGIVMERLGGPRDLEIESTISRIGRQTVHAVAPVFWHAPAASALDYFTGSSVPSGLVMRDGREGIIPVYTGLPATNPRWTVAAEDYLTGSTRLTINGRGRVGALTPPEVEDWTVENGLVRLRGSVNGMVALDCWDAAGDEWISSRTFGFYVTVGNLSTTPELIVVRNEPEEVIVRLQFPQGSGRVTVDLGLRRGSRFVTGTLKRHAATILGVEHPAGVGITRVTGGLRQTDADASGNRFVIGSTAASTYSGSWPRVQASATTRFDFFIGHEVGASPQSGDAFADLLAQYLGSTGERSRPVKRA